MKIGGIDPNTLPREEYLVLPRGDEQIVFRAVGIKDYEEFNAVCPEPKASKKMVRGEWKLDETPAYREQRDLYEKRRLAWLVLRSLEPSEIEWDTVDIDKPHTWTNWEDDLKSAGMTQVECNRVMGLVFQANCLDEDKLEKARESFVLGQVAKESEPSGPQTEPMSS